MHRLFVGLRPPPVIRAMLLAVRSGIAGARWQDDDQLHITTRFIGDVDRRTADDVAAALLRVRSACFDVAADGVGLFERRGRATTLWTRLTPSAPLERLHHKVDAALVAAGLAPERRAYRAHVTLARLNIPAATAEAFLSDHALLATPAFAVERFTLFESRLGRDGARYAAVAHYPLVRPPA